VKFRPLTRYERNPKKLKANNGGEAWWYATPGGLDLYVRSKDGGGVYVRFPIAKLRDYLKRIEAIEGATS
jgi:hypothetical protein